MYPGSKKEVEAKKTEALKRLGHKNLKLDEYESRVSNSLFSITLYRTEPVLETIANEVIHPDDIQVKFSGIYYIICLAPHPPSFTVFQMSAVSNP